MAVLHLKPKSVENLRALDGCVFRSVIRLQRERITVTSIFHQQKGSAALLTRSNPPIKKSPPINQILQKPTGRQPLPPFTCKQIHSNLFLSNSFTYDLKANLRQCHKVKGQLEVNRDHIIQTNKNCSEFIIEYDDIQICPDKVCLKETRRWRRECQKHKQRRRLV